MEIMGKDIDLKHIIWYYGFNGLIILDIILITIAMIFQIPDNVSSTIQFFDLIVCIILLGEYAFNLYSSPSKKDFLLDPMNILALIASIPFDAILPAFIPGINALRYLRLLRILLLSSRSKFIEALFEKTDLPKIIIAIFITIISFTLVFRLFGPSFKGIDDLYFVIVTLTTVGYGDVTPQTYNEKVLSMILILIGILVFSTITATITSYFTDKWDDDEDVAEIKQSMDEKTDIIMEELKVARRENNQLKDEINELKNEMGELKELIRKK